MNWISTDLPLNSFGRGLKGAVALTAFRAALSMANTPDVLKILIEVIFHFLPL